MLYVLDLPDRSLVRCEKGKNLTMYTWWRMLVWLWCGCGVVWCDTVVLHCGNTEKINVGCMRWV